MNQAVLKLQGQQGQPNSKTTKSMKVAIINGTHLCLLPPPKYHQQRQQQQQDESKNKDGKTNKSNNEADEAITQLKVPAISLRFIPNILNCKTQINVNENEMDILEKEEFASSSEIATAATTAASVTSIAPTITSNNHTAGRNIFTNNGLLMWKDYIIDQQTMQQCFENGHASSFTPRIELQLHCPQGGTSFDSYSRNLTLNCSGRGSESGNGDGIGNGKSNDIVGDNYCRENTSRKRQRSQNEHPTLTVAHVNANGGIFIRNNNNIYSNNRKYNNNINHYSYTLMQKDEENQLLQIDNQNAGYIIADFFGYNALEQILFLPPMSSLSSLSLINQSMDIINGNRNQGKFVQNGVCNSILPMK
jgi:hypothetical protein